jgi:hypothetical protein
MSLKLSAERVRQRAEATFDVRVKAATEGKIERVHHVSAALTAAVSSALDAHFAKQEQEGALPYPNVDNGTKRAWAVIVVEGFQQLDPLHARALGAHDEGQAIWKIVEDAFRVAGYEVQLKTKLGSTGSIELTVRDPEFVP